MNGAKSAELEKGFSSLDSVTTKQWIIAFVVLGILMRVVRYLLPYPLTGDEARVVSNLVGTSYGQLTQTLRFNQVAPISFLWTELFLTKTLGFSEYTVRLLSIVAGIASLGLFIQIARRLLTGVTLMLAIACFSVAHNLCVYSSQAKPYGVDLLVAMVFIAMAVEWWQNPSRVGWLWGMVGFTPVALLISFPAVFPSGGVGLACLMPVWRSRNVRAKVALGAFFVVLAISFLVMMHLTVGSQYEAVRRDMVEHWQDAFPPVLQPWRLPVWLWATFTGPLMAYPIGGGAPASIVMCVLFVIGLFVLWRTQRTELLTLTLGMIALGIAAAAIQRYPFGHAVRMVLYLAPCICLVSAIGMVRVISAVNNTVWQKRILTWGLYLLFVGIGVGGLLLVVVRPYKGRGTDIHRGFATWFWKEHSKMQTVCVDLDLHVKIYDNFPSQTYIEPAYPCYRAICDPRRGTPTNGVRCVFIHMEGAKRNEAEFEKWMARMTKRYDLGAHNTYPVTFPEGGGDERGVYEEYLFYPRATAGSL